MNPLQKAEQYASSQYDVNQYTEPDSVKGTGWMDCRDAWLAGYEAAKPDYIPYQKCPICDGNGKTIADGFISSVYQVCKCCNGAMIIPTFPLPKTPTL